MKCRRATYSESYIYNDSFPYGVLDEVITEHLCLNNLFLTNSNFCKWIIKVVYICSENIIVFPERGNFFCLV